MTSLLYGQILKGGQAVIGGALKIGASIADAGLKREQAALVQQQAEYKATLVESQATDVLQSAEEEVELYMQGVGRMASAQKAGYAAQGVKVGGGGPQAVLDAESRYVAQMNVINAKNNAAMQAWGMKAQAQEIRFGGNATARNIRFDAKQGMLSGIAGGIAQIGSGFSGSAGASGGGGGGFAGISELTGLSKMFGVV